EGGVDQYWQIEPGDEPAPIDLEAQPEQLDRSYDVTGRLGVQAPREQAHELPVVAGIDGARRMLGELRGQHAQGMRDELARLLLRVFAEQLRRREALRGVLHELAHRHARACSWRSASAWKKVRQATITSSMSPSITAARL